MKPYGTISQKNVYGTISQKNVYGTISQKNVYGTITEGSYISTPPAFDSAEIGTVADNKLVITFDQNLNESYTPATTVFSVSGVSGSPSVSSVVISGTDVTLTLSSDASEGETITVSYTVPSSNFLRGEDGDAVENFSDESVTNNVLPAYSDEYLDVYNAMTAGIGAPSDADALIQAAMLDALVAGGYYAKAEFLGVFCDHNGSKLDWRNPTLGISASYIPHVNGYDWPDANSDGIGDGWAKASGAGVGSIVTGNGFTGNAQRITHITGTTTTLQYSTGVNAVSGTRYRVKGKYRCGGTFWNVYLRGGGTDVFFYDSGGIPVNTGDASFFEFTIKATASTEIILCFQKGSAIASDYLEIDEVEVMTWNHNPTLLNNPTHTPYTGFLSNRTAYKYLNLNFIPSTDCLVAGQDNICVIIGIATNKAEDYYDFGSGGAANANSIKISPRATDNNAYYSCNSAASSSTASASSIAHFAVSRGNAANFDYHRNLVKVNKTVASTGLSPATLLAGGYNLNGAVSITNKNQVYHFVFSYLTDAEVKAVIGIMNTYLTNYGTNLY